MAAADPSNRADVCINNEMAHPAIRTNDAQTCSYFFLLVVCFFCFRPVTFTSGHLPLSAARTFTHVKAVFQQGVLFYLDRTFLFHVLSLHLLFFNLHFLFFVTFIYFSLFNFVIFVCVLLPVSGTLVFGGVRGVSLCGLLDLFSPCLA